MNEMLSQFRLDRLSSFEGITLTEHTYNLAIGLTLTVGILVDLAMAWFLADTVARMNTLVILAVYLIGSFGCTFVIYRSKNPVISFAGFLGLSAAMGLLLTNLITAYSLGSIRAAFTITGVVFVVMVALSTAFPQTFLSIGRGLGIALLTTLVVEVIAGLLFRTYLTMSDYAVALIFCGYVGYDWARAQQYPKTLDNAIDCAADIFVDIINLFIRILRIVERSRRD